MLKRLLFSPWSGVLVMVAGPFISAFTSGWVTFAIGAVWTIASLFRDNRILRAQRTPVLRLVFDPAREPYVKDYGETGKVMRYFRVGVINDGLDTAVNVAVLLLDCMPTNGGVHQGHELKQMARRGTGRFSVSHSKEPHVFVDVLVQHLDSARPVSHVQFCYVQDGIDRNLVFGGRQVQNRYELRLALDGAGAEPGRKFTLLLGKSGELYMLG